MVHTIPNRGIRADKILSAILEAGVCRKKQLKLGAKLIIKRLNKSWFGVDKILTAFL